MELPDDFSAEPVEFKMTFQTSFLAASASSLMVSLVRRVMPSFCRMAPDEQPAVMPDQEEPFMERAWIEGAKSREMEHIERWSEVQMMEDGPIHTATSKWAVPFECWMLRASRWKGVDWPEVSDIVNAEHQRQLGDLGDPVDSLDSDTDSESVSQASRLSDEIEPSSMRAKVDAGFYGMEYSGGHPDRPYWDGGRRSSGYSSGSLGVDSSTSSIDTTEPGGGDSKSGDRSSEPSGTSAELRNSSCEDCTSASPVFGLSSGSDLRWCRSCVHVHMASHAVWSYDDGGRGFAAGRRWR